jgi:hypothetical protein
MPLKRTAADGRPQLNGKALGALLNRSPKRAMKPLPIPEEEQLRALSFGLKDTYQLLTEYLGDLNKALNFRQYITVTKAQLAEYVRRHPDRAVRHVTGSTHPKGHELPVLERVDGKYRVYELDHNRPRYVREFVDLAEAVAEYLMWGW